MQMPEGNTQRTPPAPSMPVAVKTALLALLVVLCAMVLCHVTFLKVTTITTVGNVNVSREEIISLCGLNRPVSILNIREKDVRKGIDSHALLTYEKMEYEGLSSLVIYVSERLPAANLIIHDGVYKLDAEGLVLEKSDGNLDNGLINLTGMNVKRTQSGEVVTVVDRGQLEAYCAVMAEINVQKCAGEFSELNVTQKDNLYLVSTDGYAIALGDQTEMRAKLFTVRGVLNEVRALGYEVGALDATVPGYCIYTPPDL